MPQVTPFELLRAIFPDPLRPGSLVLHTTTFRNGSERTAWCRSLRQAARLTERYRKTRQVAFGVALQDSASALRLARSRRKRVTLGNVRGTDTTATALPALWVNIQTRVDIETRESSSAHDAGQSLTLPPNRQAASSLLDAIPCPPSIVMAAGHRLSVLWLLEEPWLLSTESDTAEAKGLLHRIQWALEQRAATEGWHLSAESDLAQLLPIAGTFTARGGRQPVTVERFPLVPGENRYPRQAFADLPEPPALDTSSWQALVGSFRRPDSPAAGTADMQAVWQGCSWLRECHAQRASLPESWWRAALSIISRCAAPGVDSLQLAHALSRSHPGYSRFATDELFDQQLRAPAGPRRCREIADDLGARDSHCSRCPHFGRIESPVDLGYDANPTPPAAPAAAAAQLPSSQLPSSQRPTAADATDRSTRHLRPDSDAADTGIPVIVISTRQHEVNRQALTALAKGTSRVFEHGGQLVEIPQPHRGSSAAAPVLKSIPEARLQELLAEHCTFVSPSRRDPGTGRGPGTEPEPVQPPRWTTRAILARGSWPELPWLAGWVDVPVLRPDGSVLQVPGYDAATGLMLVPSTRFAPVPARPSKEHCRQSLALFRQVFQGQDFVCPSQFAAWLACLLTPLARPAFEGPPPITLLGGTDRRWLADLTSTLLTGQPIVSIVCRGGRLTRRSLNSLAQAGTRLAWIETKDRIPEPLERALAEGGWSYRRPGANERIFHPITWLASESLELSRPIATITSCLGPQSVSRRASAIRAEVLERVRRHRGCLLPAALTLLRAYTSAGRPVAGSPPQVLPEVGLPVGWSDLVRSAVVWAGLPDPGRAGLPDRVWAGLPDPAELTTNRELPATLPELASVEPGVSSTLNPEGAIT